MEQLAISKLTKCNKDQINYPIKSFTVGKQAKGGLMMYDLLPLFVLLLFVQRADTKTTITDGHKL